MTRKRARLYILLLVLTGFATATALVLLAMRDNISYFRTPSEIAADTFPESHNHRGFRLGGLVEKGSLQRAGTSITFRVTDLKAEVIVQYDGVIPDLFREGQGVVAEGHINDVGIFAATSLLAKHDEKYMPPEVARALKDAGHDPTKGSP